MNHKRSWYRNFCLRRKYATGSFALLLLFSLAISTGCTQSVADKPGTASSLYIPGLGESMGATQMRHLKLWYAGEAENWALADYELDEIEEGFADIVCYHPDEHKDSPYPHEATGSPVYNGAGRQAAHSHLESEPTRLHGGLRCTHPGLQRMPCSHPVLV